MSALLEIANRSSTHPIINNIHRSIKILRNTGRIELYWIKAHHGLLGNERADTEAKKAATLNKTPDYDNFPISYDKRLRKQDTEQAHELEYSSSKTGAHLKQWLPKLEHIKALREKANITFELTQILTGHGYHKSYLYRFKITENDMCPSDNTSVQTIEHILKCCPQFGKQRCDHEMLCGNLRIEPYNILDLMKKESALTSFLRLITFIVNNLKKLNST
ncbi:unnamed protein product [Parnassius mnemosyne]|uniref:RNase H type-1 domain-containing protein n=1 Tax=Parnassius mnemosyne TaxID=213953 RepID=A0AAV1LYI3_9NEOP